MFRVLFLLWFTFHPMHVSVLTIDYMPETSNFKGFVRIYLDDLILDCRQSGLEISREKLVARDKASSVMVERYLNEKIVISVNEKLSRGRLTSIDIDAASNEVDVNMLFENTGKPETITVKNLIMTTLHKDQTNMVIVKADDFEEGVKFTPELTERTFKIN